MPLVADRDVVGLQEAEREAAAAIQAIRDADTREEADRLRRAALKTEDARLRALRKADAERRKALRAERRDFAQGQRVNVDDIPAFAGLTGVVESSDGASAIVVFGGSLSMKIEAWQLTHDPVQGPQS